MDFKKIINVAVIAHVDAGNSTLVDAFWRSHMSSPIMKRSSLRSWIQMIWKEKEA